MLRPVETSDVEMFWPDSTDTELTKYLPWNPHADKSQTLAFLKYEVARRESGEGINWAIFRDGVFCGIVGLIALIRQHSALTYNQAELTYWLGREHQHQGIAMEAASRVLLFGFQELCLHKICVFHFSSNEPSERLVKRLGFRYTGERIEELKKNGTWYNVKYYEMLDKEFDETI